MFASQWNCNRLKAFYLHILMRWLVESTRPLQTNTLSFLKARLSQKSNFLYGNWFLPGYVPICKKWRLQFLKAFAQETITESFLPYFIQQSSPQAHPDSKGKRHKPQVSTGDLNLKPALSNTTRSLIQSPSQRTDGSELQWIRLVHMYMPTPLKHHNLNVRSQKGTGQLRQLAIYSVFILLPISKAGKVIRKKKKK